MRIAFAGGTGIAGGFAVESAYAAGHEVVVLSRARGVDLLSDVGLLDALRGVEVIVDTTNISTRDGSKAAEFFETVTSRLHRLGAEAGVDRLVCLSIVGIDRAASFGYYAAKLRQEEAVRAGALSSTIVRATQFHEFAGQMIAQFKAGGVATVPVMRSQPISARTLGTILVGTAVAPPEEQLIEIAGPQVEDVVSMARRLIRHRRRRIKVIPLRMPGDTGRAFRGGALVPTGQVRVVGPMFDDWLDSEDSALPTF